MYFLYVHICITGYLRTCCTGGLICFSRFLIAFLKSARIEIFKVLLIFFIFHYLFCASVEEQKSNVSQLSHFTLSPCPFVCRFLVLWSVHEWHDLPVSSLTLSHMMQDFRWSKQGNQEVALTVSNWWQRNSRKKKLINLLR